MGGDGGVIATQRKFVRGAKSDEIEEGKNVKRQQVIRTTTCALSTEVDIKFISNSASVSLLKLYPRFYRSP